MHDTPNPKVITSEEPSKLFDVRPWPDSEPLQNTRNLARNTGRVVHTSLNTPDRRSVWDVRRGEELVYVALPRGGGLVEAMWLAVPGSWPAFVERYGRDVFRQHPDALRPLGVRRLGAVPVRLAA